MTKIRISTLVFFLAAGVTFFSLQHRAYAVSCDAIVGKWAWFTGGVVTINPDGTMVHEPGNDGTWECTDASRGMFILMWRIGGYINTLALSADGQGLSSTDQSQWYVTARRIGGGTKAGSFSPKVTSLRFFESGYNAPPREQRVYSNRFDKSKTRYVHWELNLEFPAPGRRVSFPIEQFWYRADNSLVTRQTWQASIEPNWTWSYHNHGYGWNNPGNWEVGSYRVDLYVEGQKLASGSFEIYEAAPAEAYFSRGIDHRKKGMLDEAIVEFTKAIEINPKYAEAYHNRGVTYFMESQLDQAISDYTKAIEINPKYAEAYTSRGNVYSIKGQDDQAISDYTRAIEINPKHAEAYANRGVTYYYKGEYDKAWENVHKAQELGAPIDPEFLDKLRKASGREG